MTILLPLRFRIIVLVCLFLSALSVIFILNNTQDKHKYANLVGTIIYKSDKLGDLPNRNFGKYRYITLDTYSLPFELYIGKDFGDFKPLYERLDSLQVGDFISVFFYETENDKNEGINRNIQFI